MLTRASTLRTLEARYWPLIKSWQTGLLVVTGVAGYLSAGRPAGHGWTLLGLIGSLWLAISGGTALNMGFDHDIDAEMARTCRRPTATGEVSPGAAWRLGTLLLALGLAWALCLSPRFAALVLAGLFFEVVVYTLWLKRRTPWSIVWGGLAGGMPLLAGRTLATGEVDKIGLLLALSVLFWVPIHNLTLSVLHLDDYRRAGVPTFPVVAGRSTTRCIIVASSLLTALAMTTAFVWMRFPTAILCLSILLGAGLLWFALRASFRPSDRTNAGLFKYASVYMLCCMVLLAVGGLGAPVWL
jgi:protoheme IX farnesyltransferase